jgi:selenocysteine lyase/cysteine desulfurase
VTSSIPSMELAAAQALWNPDTVYLNTASYGLPPRPAVDALTAAQDEWRHGRTSWEKWGDATEISRGVFAELVGASVEDIAIGTTVSEFTGMIANSLPEGAHVLVPDMEFTSNLFPYFTHSDRGVTVETVPAADLPGAIGPSTTAVAFSAVQSSSGEVADLSAIETAAAKHDALTIVDGTQGCGWLPLDATRFDFFVVHGYKWLMSPRGTSFLYVNPEQRKRIRPLSAGWYAGENVHDSYYGPPLRLAESARRFDRSPVWFSWVGTQPSLELIRNVGIEAIHAHNVRLANLFRAEMHLEPGNSAIVSVETSVESHELEKEGIQAASRAGNLRLSFHIYNTESDVETLLKAVAR